LKAAVTGDRVDTFGGGRPLFVNGFGLVSAHPLAPLCQRWRIGGQWLIRVTRRIFGFGYRGVDGDVDRRARRVFYRFSEI
jgi:hypothetical protein